MAAAHPELLGRLAGCGLSWCLYDFMYYGTSFNQVTITDAVFGKADALIDNCWQNALLSAMGLPGVAFAIMLLNVWSSRTLQLWGFVATAAACLALALATTAGASEGVKFALLSLLVFSLNWGVNVSTYVLPAEMFPQRSAALSLACRRAWARWVRSLAALARVHRGRDGFGRCLLHLRCRILAGRSGDARNVPRPTQTRIPSGRRCTVPISGLQNDRLLPEGQA